MVFPLRYLPLFKSYKRYASANTNTHTAITTRHNIRTNPNTLISPFQAMPLSDRIIDLKRLKNDDQPTQVELRDRTEEAGCRCCISNTEFIPADKEQLSR